MAGSRQFNVSRPNCESPQSLPDYSGLFNPSRTTSWAVLSNVQPSLRDSVCNFRVLWFEAVYSL
jgi:hypothetical protein